MRALQEKSIEILRRVLDEEHPDTTISAWNLFTTCHKEKDHDAGVECLKDHLIWLLERDPATLGEDQRKIREMVGEVTGQ